MTFELAIGTIGIVIAFLAYLRTFKPPPKEEPIDERENLKAYFLMVQKLYNQTIDLIELHIDLHSAENDFIFEEVTFGYYLQKMKIEFERCNSDEVYKNIILLPHSKSSIESMMHSLKVQYDSLTQVKFKMEVLLNI